MKSIIAIILTMAVILTGSGAAKPPIPPPHPVLWGLDETPCGVGCEQPGYTAARTLGITTMRVELPPVVDVTSYDPRFTLAAQKGVRVLPLLNAWNAAGIYPNTATYSAYVAQFTARYGSGGTFWNAHPELPPLPPTYIELLNEPDLVYDHDNNWHPDEYARLVKATVTAGRAANPQAKYLVYAGATVDRIWGHSPADWVNGMIKAVPTIGNYIDMLEGHPYGGFAALTAARNAWVQKHITRDVWVTELGNPGDPATLGGEEAQAWILGQWANTVKQTSWIAAFFWFQWRDSCSGTPDCTYGLWREDGVTPKLAASAYATVITGG